MSEIKDEKLSIDIDVVMESIQGKKNGVNRADIEYDFSTVNEDLDVESKANVYTGTIRTAEVLIDYLPVVISDVGEDPDFRAVAEVRLVFPNNKNEEFKKLYSDIVNFNKEYNDTENRFPVEQIAVFPREISDFVVLFQNPLSFGVQSSNVDELPNQIVLLYNDPDIGVFELEAEE